MGRKKNTTLDGSGGDRASSVTGFRRGGGGTGGGGEFSGRSFTSAQLPSRRRHFRPEAAGLINLEGKMGPILLRRV